AGLDPKTGMPIEYDPALREGGIQQYAIAPLLPDPAPRTCPNHQGGNNHWPTSYSDRTGFMYATAIEGCRVASGGAVRDTYSQTSGSVTAVDADGNITARVQTPFAPYGGQLTTAGGLLFSSMTNGDFYAMDDTTLETLWSINLGSAIEAPP